MDSSASSPECSTTRSLADFRHALRRFLRFSEEAAERAGLTAQQHQLLLQIGGASSSSQITVGYLAERLLLRHNSVVELIDRSQDAGLLQRGRDPVDRRLVVLQLTPEGSRVLHKLSQDHARELNELGPELVNSFKSLIP